MTTVVKVVILGDMGKSHVVSALEKKRAELSGRLLEAEKHKTALELQLDHIDNTLAIFGYQDEPALIKPVRPIDVRFKRRELRMLIWKIEQDATEPLTHRDIALIIMQSKDLDITDAKLADKMTHSVRNAKSWNNRRKRLIF